MTPDVPAPPAVVMDLALVAGDGADAPTAIGAAPPWRVTLSLVQRWEGRGVDPDPARNVDPVTTLLAPRLVKEATSDAWLLTGHALTTHDAPNDTRVTWSLLCEVHADGTLEGLWHEDHMEIPRLVWRAAGRIDGRAVELLLTPVDPEQGAARALRGAAWRAGNGRAPR